MPGREEARGSAQRCPVIPDPLPSLAPPQKPNEINHHSATLSPGEHKFFQPPATCRTWPTLPPEGVPR